MSVKDGTVGIGFLLGWYRAGGQQGDFVERVLVPAKNRAYAGAADKLAALHSVLFRRQCQDWVGKICEERGYLHMIEAFVEC